MIFADVKADVKQQEIEELVVALPSKFEMQCETGVYFSFNFTWYSISSLILSVQNLRVGGFYLPYFL